MNPKLLEWHSFNGSIKWRLTHEGIETTTSELGASLIDRTIGKPVTVTKIWETYRNEIIKSAEQCSVPVELIIATIATESRGVQLAVRHEPGYVNDDQTPHKVSAGLMQPLLSTARHALNDVNLNLSELLRPAVNIMAGTSYMSLQAPKTSLDPPMVAAAYNSGGVYPNDSIGDRWRMRCYPIGKSDHIDRFVSFFNDTMAMMAENDTIPSMSFTRQVKQTITSGSPPLPPIPPTPQPEPTPVEVSFWDRFMQLLKGMFS
jgi:hypothetical protein